MFEVTINKYFKNFSKIIPYIIITFFIELIILKLSVEIIGFNYLSKVYFNSGNIEPYINGNGGQSILTFGLSIALCFIIFGPIFASFIRLVFKKIIDNEDIVYTKSFIKSFKLYFKYLGLIVLIGLMVFGISMLFVLSFLLGAVGFLFAIPIFLGLIYVITIFTPCTEYLIYYEESVDNAFSKGRKVGQRYFWIILLQGIIVSVLQQVFTLDNVKYIWIFIITMFITKIINNFIIFYRMNLCATYEESIKELV